MSFKDHMRDDIHNVFINTDEFAGIHNLNGVKYPCAVFEVDDIPSDPVKQIGTHRRQIDIYIDSELLPGRPTPGMVFTVDGTRWVVINLVDELDGARMYTIRLEASRT